MSAMQRVAAGEALRFDARRLERVFALCFADRWRTRLLGGATEPFYRPATGAGDCHELHYREDYFASALHEVAHWCIAGDARRRLPDFGYWYLPDGRSVDQQRAFEAVEYRPQALEWWFSRACGYRFRPSADNLHDDGATQSQVQFARRIAAQAGRWARQGLPGRAALFFDALCREFDTALDSASRGFSVAELG